MTHNEKELLLKDLSARLPYEVKYMDILNPDEHPSTLQSIDNCGLVMANDGFSHEIENVKPYLFPLSRICDNEELGKEFDGLIELELKAISGEIPPEQATEFEVDFYNKHHLDWRGLIPMGLAIDATNLKIY